MILLTTLLIFSAVITSEQIDTKLERAKLVIRKT